MRSSRGFAPLVVLLSVVSVTHRLAHADATHDLLRTEATVPPSVSVLPGISGRIVVSEQVDFGAQMDDDRGSMSRARTWSLLEVERRLDDRWSIRFEAELEVDLYEIRQSERIFAGPGRLLDTGIRTHLEPGVDWRLSSDWKLGVDVAVETTSVPGASLGDAYTFSPSAYVWHRFSPSVALRFGLSVFAYLDDSPLIVPFIAPDDVDATSPTKWRFEGRGTGGRFGYAFTPSLTLGVAAAYDRRDWRLAPDDRVPGGIARDIRASFGVFAEVATRDRFMLGLEVGFTAYQKFEIADRDGNALTRVEAEPSAYLAFSLGWRF